MTTSIYTNITADGSIEPVSLTDAKAWMRYAPTNEDDMITDLIRTARRILEKHTSLSFVRKTIEALIDVQDEWVDLPHGPTVSVTTVVDRSTFGSPLTLTDGTDYELVGKMLRFSKKGAMLVTYEAGYVSLPDDLRTDIFKLVAWLFQNRGIQFNAEDKLRKTPEWQALASHNYAKVVI